jgi:hypothetical protein
MQNKKNLLIFSLFIAAFVLLLSLIVNSSFQNKNALRVNPQLALTQSPPSYFSNIIYSGPLINTPPTLPHAKVSTNPSLTEPIVFDTLVNTYQLSPTTPGKIWQNINSNENESVTLIKFPGNGCYELIIAGTPHPDLAIWDTSTIFANATNFLTRHLQLTNLYPLSDQLVYWYGEYETEVATATDSNIVIVPFVHQIVDLPVYYKTLAGWPFTVYLNNQHQPFRLDYCPQFIALEPSTTTYPTISLEQAVSNINANSTVTSIISANQKDYETFDNTRYTSGTLTSVSLEYRIDETAALAYPFYRFSGTLYDSAQVPVDVELITPAINVTVE